MSRGLGMCIRDSPKTPPEAKAIPSAPRVLSMSPVCACGCGETRALVGGSLARLGATIPAIHLAALPAAIHVDGPPRAGLGERRVFFGLDPVPI